MVMSCAHFVQPKLQTPKIFSLLSHEIKKIGKTLISTVIQRPSSVNRSGSDLYNNNRLLQKVWWRTMTKCKATTEWRWKPVSVQTWSLVSDESVSLIFLRPSTDSWSLTFDLFSLPLIRRFYCQNINYTNEGLINVTLLAPWQQHILLSFSLQCLTNSFSR